MAAASGMAPPSAAAASVRPSGAGGRGVWTVLKWATLLRVLTLALMVASNLLFPDHQATGVFRYQAPKQMNPAAGAFTKWDAAWFVHLADKGYPRAPWRLGDTHASQPPHSDVDFFEEQAYAFFPLYPWVVRQGAAVLQLATGLEHSLLVVPMAVLVSNVAFVASAAALFHLSRTVLGDSRQALWAALAYCANPASVFFSTAYSESTFALLTFTGFAVLLGPSAARRGVRRSLVAWWCALLLCASTATRSNGTSNVLVFGIAKLHWLVDEALSSRKTTWRITRWLRLLLGVLATALQAVLIVSPYVLVQVNAYREFCAGASAAAREQHPWCDHTMPSLYAWVQQRYWGVGLLRYYTWRNLPNFLLAAPVVAVSSAGIAHLWNRSTWTALLETLHLVVSSMGVRTKPSFAAQQRAHCSTSSALAALPPRMSYCSMAFAMQWALLLAAAVLAMNVQVATRFLAAGCAPLHWWMGQLLAGARGKVLKRLTWAWVVVYCIAGPITHCNFLPWT